MTDGAIFSAAALTAVLVVSALGKLRDPRAFRRALSTFKIIPPSARSMLMVTVPLVELSLAGLQWVSTFQPWIGVAMVSMFVVFTFLLLASLITGERARCGCFGRATSEPVSWFSIVRNLVLIGLAVMGMVAGDGAARGALPAALSGIGAGALILLLDQGITTRERSGFRPERTRG